MGLNLETLIGILVILILLILVDGMRRMIRERHGRLRMRIDPRYRDQPEEEEDRGHNPELIGSARVIRRAMEEDQKERPPMVMEPDEAAADTRTAEQQSLFEAEQGSAPQPGGAPEPQPEVAPAPNPSAVERQPESTPEPREAPRQEPRIEPKAAPKTPREPQPVLEVIVVHLIAHRGAPFDGGALLRMLLEAGLRYGRMNIFHRHVSVNGADDLQFSMANAVEPGTFDLDTMESKTFAEIGRAHV